MKTFSELSNFDSLEDRYSYLALGGTIGLNTFGFERYLNQQFYRSREWRHIRDVVISRDMGMDLGVPEVGIRGNLYVHHMNPLELRDIEEGSDNLLDPEGLITCSLRTHNAIHYGDKGLLPQPFVERRPGDTKLWG